MGPKAIKEFDQTIGKEYICPSCDQVFASTTPSKIINEHSKDCANHSTIQKKRTIDLLGDDELFIDINYISESHYLPKSNSFNTLQSIKSFETKVKEFQSYISSIKISWTLGCDTLHIKRDNALNDSIEKFKSINLLKELKIDFAGEVSYDAGGIIREWFTVLINELESREMKLFQKSDCDEYSYVLSNLLKNTPQSMKYLYFLGQLIGKALIENITINLCFNKIIYKLLLDEEIKFDDLKYINKVLYNSLVDLKKFDASLLSEMFMFYVYEYHDENNVLITEELIPNGGEILVKDINDYIEKRIDHMINRSKIFIDELKKGLNSIISFEELENFNSYELELVINGKPFIDLNEWRLNSEYKGKYHKTHYCVAWFWEALSKKNQEQLSKFLQFCTGTSRVPVSGFAKLESNRGEVAKFCINQVPYNSKGGNYIKAHTCFNRIDLPLYKKQAEVEQAVMFVLQNEIIGFGID